MAASTHPIWEVYDLFRTSRFNVKYWSEKLVRLRRQNFCIEYGLMATAPGSALAGLVFWSTTSGKVVWTILTSVTALLAIAKPLLKLSDRLTQLQKVVTHYRLVDCQLEALTNDIRREGRYSGDLVAVFKSLQAQVSEISKYEPFDSVDEKLRWSLYEEVNNELPMTSFQEPSK